MDLPRTVFLLVLGGFVASALVGCSDTATKRDGPPPGGAIDVSRIPDAVPRPEPTSRYGNPASYRVNGKTYHTLKSSRGYRERGVASWYGSHFHGRRTSSGEPYDMYAMSAAHRALPLPTYARVTNLGNSRSVVLRINDRGPFHANRIIDLSYAAAAKLGIVGPGTGLVEVEAIDPSLPDPPQEDAPVSGSTDTTHPPHLYLQIGAFSTRSNAERLKSRISPAVPVPVRIQRLERAARPLYRVKIGPLDSVQLADDLSERLRREWELVDTHAVVE